jgi:hypothetical protein
MSLVVTVNTERYQIVEPIMAEFASSGEMVYLQVLWCTAMLASPAVPFEDLVAKNTVFFGVELVARSFLLKCTCLSHSLPRQYVQIAAGYSC